MKKILLIITVFFLVISCAKNDKGQTMTEESVEIMDNYVNTLETSVDDAKEVKALMESRQDVYSEDNF